MALALVLLIVLCGAMVLATAPPGDEDAGSVLRPRYAVQLPVQPGHRVLILHSYGPDYSWTAGISVGIQWALEAHPGLATRTMYMDTKRKTSAAWIREISAEVLAQIEEWDPDIVIAVDDNAQEYVGRYLVGRNRPQIVFCGLNAEPSAYGYPAENVTGVLERSFVRDTVLHASELLPGLQKIRVLSDDSATSRQARSHIEQQLQGQIEFDVVYAKTMQEWASAVDEAAGHEAILVYLHHTLSDKGQTTSMPPSDVMAWTVQHSSVPVLGCFDFTINDGALCGVVASPSVDGQLAGDIAIRLLGGERAQDIDMVTPSRGSRALNVDAAHRWNVALRPSAIEKADLLVEVEHD